MYDSDNDTDPTSSAGRDGGDNATEAILPQTRVPYVAICYQGHRNCEIH